MDMNQLRLLLLRGPSNIKQANSYNLFIKRHIEAIRELELSTDDENIIIGHMTTAKLALANRYSKNTYFDLILNKFDS